ncbi:MAG: glycosyltransferase, partial [Acidimicrobiales bacterium]|nr:glycosyltransferase [Acidimicrobiales bacterium]
MSTPGRSDIRRTLGTRHRRPDLTGAVRLSVVLPSYREERIGASVERVRGALAHLDGGVEIVVVDDGSG